MLILVLLENRLVRDIITRTTTQVLVLQDFSMITHPGSYSTLVTCALKCMLHMHALPCNLQLKMAAI